VLFLFLPLVKPFLVVSEKISAGPESVWPVYSGIRIPDPNNLLWWAEWVSKVDVNREVFIADMNYLLIFFIAVVVVVLLIIRWFSLSLLYRRLAYEDKVSREDIPVVYRIIDNFSERLSIRPPDVSLAHRHYYSPFVVGIRYCTIVIYPSILEILELEEKEILLHHELSHIKRKDNLIGWVAMILRDLMFFNPFAYIAYNLIRSEQDRGSDKLVVFHSDRQPKEIARNLLNAVKKLGELGTYRNAPGIASDFFSGAGRFMAHLRLKIRIRTILENDGKRITMGTFPRIMMFIIFFVILVFQVLVVINLGQYQLYLR